MPNIRNEMPFAPEDVLRDHKLVQMVECALEEVRPRTEELILDGNMVEEFVLTYTSSDDAVEYCLEHGFFLADNQGIVKPGRYTQHLNICEWWKFSRLKEVLRSKLLAYRPPAPDYLSCKDVCELTGLSEEELDEKQKSTLTEITSSRGNMRSDFSDGDAVMAYKLHHIGLSDQYRMEYHQEWLRKRNRHKKLREWQEQLLHESSENIMVDQRVQSKLPLCKHTWSIRLLEWWLERLRPDQLPAFNLLVERGIEKENAISKELLEDIVDGVDKASEEEWSQFFISDEWCGNEIPSIEDITKEWSQPLRTDY